MVEVLMLAVVEQALHLVLVLTEHPLLVVLVLLTQ
jgi:hypothetical protein